MALDFPPPPSAALAGLSDGEGHDSLFQRLDRYAIAHRFSLSTAEYLDSLGDREASRLSGRLRACGSYLVFRHFFDFDETKLHSMVSCDHALLCPLCAIRRASRAVGAYWRRWEIVAAERPDLRLYHITFTVRDGEDLLERFGHLRRSLQRYHDLRKEALRGRRPPVLACRAAGAVWSYEFKRGSGSGLWHPHVHCLWACDRPPCQSCLRYEWQNLTGDSFQVKVVPLRDVSGFIEVFKYALKFSTMSPADTWCGFRTLRGLRLVGSFGCFRGVQVPSDLTDDETGLTGPYVDLLFRYFEGRYYLRQSSPDATICNDPRLDSPIS